MSEGGVAHVEGGAARDDEARQRLLHRPGGGASALAGFEEAPPSCQPKAPNSDVLSAAVQIPTPRFGHGRALTTPYASVRRRFRIPCTTRHVYTAGDYIIGVILWLGIWVLVAAFYGVVVPAGEKAVLVAARAGGHDVDGNPLPLPNLWFADVRASSTAPDELGTPGHAPSTDPPLDTRSKRWVSSSCTSVLEHWLGRVKTLATLLVGVAQVLLSVLLVADPGFEDDPEDDPVEAAAQRRRDEEQAQRLMPSLPPTYGPDERANVFEAQVSKVTYERRWMETVERDVHMCPICRFRVRGFDHHCGIIGACIGRGTMPLFILFLASTAAVLACGLWVSIPTMGLLLLHGHLFFFPPLVTVVVTCLFNLFAFYLGAYTAFLACFYTSLGFRGDFSLGRRRRAKMEENPSARSNVDAQPLCRFGRWRWGNLVDVLAPLLELRLATR